MKTLPLSLPRLWWLLPLLSLIGFIDAIYLTASHYLGGDISCFLVGGCDVVTTSVYSTIGPIPVALLGALFYLTVLVLALLFFQTRLEVFLKLILALALVAFVASLYFLFLQIFILQAYCSYCLLSALISTLILLTALWLCVKLEVWILRKKL